MNDRPRDLLRDVARLADELGPALAPAGQLELLESITDAAKSLFEAAACSLALLDNEDSELVYYVASGEGAEDVVGMRMPSGQGIAGWVVMSGQPIAIEDVRQDQRFARGFAEQTGYVPTSILAMPLETERKMLGVISVLDRRSDGSAGSHDMELLSLFARQAALAIENLGVFSHLGHELLRAVGEAGDGDLTDTLLRIAEDSRGPSAEMAELAAHFNFLATAGDEERAAAVGILRELVTYIKARDRRR
jgi:GAF domain-containing protein